MADFNPLEPSKKILVTGAAGFIGFHLTRLLLTQGVAVTGFDNINDYYDVSLKHARLDILNQYDRFEFIKGDLADKEAVFKLFADGKFDIVVNLAAQAGVRYSITHPEVYIASNVAGFLNILEACRHSGELSGKQIEHLVYASSSSVYGNQKKLPFSVTDDVSHPISLYAATKKANELMAYTYSHLYGIPSTGLRFFTVYGPWGRPDMACFLFTKKILSGEAIQVFNDGDMYRDFTYIDDIVAGVERMLCNPPKPDQAGVRAKVYNIGNNKPEKLLRFIEVLEDKLGRTAEKEYLPIQPGDVPKTYADVTDLIEDFDFKPETSIETGIQRFADWYMDYYGIDK